MRLCQRRFARVILALCLVLSGCAGGQADRHVAEATAVTSSVALAALGQAYTAHGEREIDAAKSREEAEARLDVVRETWHPVFATWDLYAQVLRTWHAALVADDQTKIIRAALEAKRLYCRLLALVSDVPFPVDLPQIPGAPCPK